MFNDELIFLLLFLMLLLLRAHTHFFPFFCQTRPRLPRMQALHGVTQTDLPLMATPSRALSIQPLSWIFGFGLALAQLMGSCQPSFPLRLGCAVFFFDGPPSLGAHRLCSRLHHHLDQSRSTPFVVAHVPNGSDLNAPSQANDPL